MHNNWNFKNLNFFNYVNLCLFMSMALASRHKYDFDHKKKFCGQNLGWKTHQNEYQIKNKTYTEFLCEF